jgi:hypothetical protein
MARAGQRRVVDDPAAAHLRPVAHALEQAVGRAACRASARRWTTPASSGETSRIAAERRDPREVVGAVGLKRCWIPKRSRSGVVNSPAQVVAPMSVKGQVEVTTLAPAPWPMVIGGAGLHGGIEESPEPG